MTLVSSSIPNLVGGVSQQPAKLRLPSQCEEQIGCNASIIEGLTRKPPTTHIKRLIPFDIQFTAAIARNAAAHTIDRDLNERYQVIVYGGTIRVFDLVDGTEKTVNTPNGTDYLLASSSKAAISFTTIADFTFVLNKEKVVDMMPAPPDTRGVEAIVFISTANYSTDYSITIDGFTSTIKTTAFGYVPDTVSDPDDKLQAGSASNPVTISTEVIAELFAEHLTANHPQTANFIFTHSQSVVWIRRVNGAAFTAEVHDSRGNTQMSLAKETAQNLSDLPRVAPHGFQVEIVGDPSTPDDNYFVKFEQTNPSLTIGQGLWVETPKPGIPVALAASTMPHLLVREANGTFTFKQAEWGNRVAGDEDSAPNPSFVGHTINDVFVLRNRLGMLSEENAVLSRAAKFFEFFVASATALTDADPIDEAASHNKVSILKHALPFKKRLFLFSDETQFELRYADVLSGDTAEILPVWEYKSGSELGEPQISITARPVAGGKSLFFPISRSAQAAGIFEAIVEEGVTAITDAGEITEHVPTYLPAKVRKLTVAANDQMLLALTDDAPRTVFAYRFFWSSQAKLLSSWSRWDYFNEDPNSGIINIDFVGSVCAMLTYHGDGVYLERFSVAPHQRDPGWANQFKLDRRVTEIACSAVFSVANNATTITAPYPISAKTVVVARFPADHSKQPGTVATVLSRTGNQLVVLGDWFGAKFYLGETYKSRYVFSPQFLRKPAQGGGQEIVGTGRLQMRFYTIHYADTGYFEVHVTPHKGSDTYVQKVTPVLGSPEAIIGEVGISSGQVRVMIGGKNDEAQVEIVSESHLPFKLLSVDWEGTYHAHSRRL